MLILQFSSTPGFGGITCAQLFLGNSSHFTSVYGMQTESEGPSALQDFIQEHSIPSVLCNDNLKMQAGTAWNNILHKYSIKAKLTKPHHPQQNSVERHIKTVKNYTSKIMDRMGAPPETWFLCLLYSVYLLNHTAVETLGWHTPIESCFGQTPDLLSLLQFTFYELVYFLDHDAHFPETGERFSRFVGNAENHGNALTYWILTQDDKLLARLVVQFVVAQEPNQWASSSIESKGSMAPNSDPAELDLMSDLVGGSADFEPVQYLGYSCGYSRHSSQDYGHRC